MSIEQPNFQNNFVVKGEESRERIKEELNLEEDQERFRLLREKGLDLQYEKLSDLESAESPAQMAEIIDEEIIEIGNFFPEDEYSQKAQEAFFQRIKEKTRDELSGWLRGVGREDLIESIDQGVQDWKSASDIARYIQSNILSQFENADELFRAARDAKLNEFKDYYLRTRQ